MSRFMTPWRLVAFSILLLAASVPGLGQVGGSNEDVQFNDNGAQGGASELQYDKVAGSTSVTILNEARYVHLHASSGDGSSGSPWSLTSSEWTSLLAGGNETRFVKGFYDMLADDSVTLPSGTNLTCDPGAVLQWPDSVQTGSKYMLQIPADATGVVIRGCEFQPGIALPDEGEVGGLGHTYIAIGDGSSESQANFTIVGNVFGRARYIDDPFVHHGETIEIFSGTTASTIADNRFGAANFNVLVAGGDSKSQHDHDRLRIIDNNFDYDYIDNQFATAVSIGDGSASAVGARFDVLAIQGNSFRAHTAMNVGLEGTALSITDNIANSPFTDLLLRTSGPGIDRAVIADNQCYFDAVTDGPLGRPQPCGMNINNVTHLLVTGNTISGQDATSLSIRHSTKVLVANNIVDRVEDSAPGESFSCYIVHDVKHATYIGNQAVDCGHAAFEFFAGPGDVTSDVTFYNNTFVQTKAVPTMDWGFLNANLCNDCTAIGNQVLGLDLDSGFSDSPGSFAYSLANFETTDPVSEGMDFGTNRITLTDGSFDTTIAISEAPEEDTELLLPPNSGEFHQLLATDGDGSLFWQSPTLDFTDVYPSSNSGSYNAGSAAADRDGSDWAIRILNGSVAHEWTFPDVGVRTGELEVWHRLIGAGCNTDTQEIKYSTDGSSPPATLLEASAATTDWVVSTVQLVDQDLAQLIVGAEGSGGGFPPCSGHVAIIAFRESDTVRYAQPPLNVVLEGGLSVGSPTELTISGGDIAVTRTVHTVDTENGASVDRLNTILGGDEGGLLVLRSSAAGRTVEVEQTDNIVLDGVGAVSLDDPDDTLTLIKVGDNWVEISRSDNS